MGVGETSARVKQQRQRRSTQYVGKNFAYLLLPCYEAMKKDSSWLALHSGVQNKLTTTF